MFLASSAIRNSNERSSTFDTRPLTPVFTVCATPPVFVSVLYMRVFCLVASRFYTFACGLGEDAPSGFLSGAVAWIVVGVTDATATHLERCLPERCGKDITGLSMPCQQLSDLCVAISARSVADRHRASYHAYQPVGIRKRF